MGYGPKLDGSHSLNCLQAENHLFILVNKCSRQNLKQSFVQWLLWQIDITFYSNTCVKQPLKNRQHKDLNDKC